MKSNVTTVNSALTTHEDTPPLSHLIYQLTNRAHVIYIPCLAATDLAAGGGWTAVEAGTGATAALNNTFLYHTCASDIGSSLWRIMVGGLYPLNPIERVNWGKELYIQFSVYRYVNANVTNNGDVEGYVQLKPANTIGALAGDGLGIRIGVGDKTGLAIRGEAWKDSLEFVNFNTLLASPNMVVIGIHHRPGVAIDFYVNGIKQASSITTQIPTTSAGTNYLMTSLETKTDPVATIYLGAGHFFIVQAP